MIFSIGYPPAGHNTRNSLPTTAFISGIGWTKGGPEIQVQNKYHFISSLHSLKKLESGGQNEQLQLNNSHLFNKIHYLPNIAKLFMLNALDSLHLLVAPFFIKHTRGNQLSSFLLLDCTYYVCPTNINTCNVGQVNLHIFLSSWFKRRLVLHKQRHYLSWSGETC